MNRAVTIAFRADGTPSVLTGPEVPIEKQSAAFKTYIQRGIPGVETVELWTSNAGRVKRKTLRVTKAETIPVAEIEPAPATKKPTSKGR